LLIFHFLIKRNTLSNPAYYINQIKQQMNRVASLFGMISLLIASVSCQHGVISKTQTANTKPETKAIIKEKWHWGNAQKQNESAGYAQVVKAGNTIYISGVPTADMSAKGIANVYKILGECLSAFGTSSKDVVKETLYTTDIEGMKKYSDVRKEFYKNDFPAATWVQISRLYEAEAKLEIELIAQVPDNR